MFLKYVLRNIYACLTAIMNGSPIPTALDRNPGIQEFEETQTNLTLCLELNFSIMKVSKT